MDASNNGRLAALTGEAYKYEAIDSGDKNKADQCIAPRILNLKKDAQVMLLKNYDSQLVNGSLGIIVGFTGEPNYESAMAIYSRLPPKYNQPGSDKDIDLVSEMKAKNLPVVKFANGREIIVDEETWSVELPGKMDGHG